MTLEVDSWSTTAASNTSIAGINIAENCLAANMNDALRANMAAIAAWKAAVVAAYAASGANTDITALDQDVTITATGTIAAGSIGYRGVPAGQAGGGLTLALSDASKRIRLTSGGLTIPANASIAFPVGTVIEVVNRSGSAQTIAITSDTLYFCPSGVTGTRTIADFGKCILEKDTSTVWLITGVGLT